MYFEMESSGHRSLLQFKLRPNGNKNLLHGR